MDKKSKSKYINKTLLFILSIIFFVTVSYVIMTDEEGSMGSNDQIIKMEQQEDLEKWEQEHQKPEQGSKQGSDAGQAAVIEKRDYTFKNNELLQSHFEKHGIDMGFSNSAEYEKAASAVINNPDADWKYEKEDNDMVFYIEETNEIVFLSRDGFIRTYFWPDNGKAYYDKQ